jgi:hypothetical protein
VVCRWLRLALAATYGGHDTCHAGAARFLFVTTIIVGHVCDPLETLLASLLATPSTLFNVLDHDVEWHPPATDRGCLPTSGDMAKFDRLITGGVLGGGTM